MPRGRRSFSYAAWRHVLQVLQPAAAGWAGLDVHGEAAGAHKDAGVVARRLSMI
jgi:hypothetical protein